jgi:hypothetical protein
VLEGLAEVPHVVEPGAQLPGETVRLLHAWRSLDARFDDQAGELRLELREPSLWVGEGGLAGRSNGQDDLVPALIEQLEGRFEVPQVGRVGEGEEKPHALAGE